MAERLLRVTTRGFVAGLVVRGERGKGDQSRVIEAAPILRWTMRLTWRQVRAELVRKRCSWQWI